ncbi:MAG: hypothetical protein GQ582_08480 [Methyloprofundus sp.]|nr:hypothetical protein [Methyloprofundus sp.]
MKDVFESKKIPQGSILGLNYSGMHDTAIAIVSPQGKILYAISLERISRVKQDGRHPTAILNGLPWEKISKVAISVEHHYTPADNLSSKYCLSPFNSPDTVDRSHADLFYQALSFIPVEIEKVFIPHHLCHAASVFWLSGYTNATCLVYDGGMANEDWFGGVYRASTQTGIQAIDQFSINHYSSVTNLYTAITVALGYTPLKHEGKITGLAAYGKPVESCRKIMEHWLCQTPETLQKLIDWSDMYSKDIPPKLKVNAKQAQLIRDALAEYTREDIAATVQTIAEDHITGILSELIKQGEASENLCLSGGIFANVKINQLASELGFKATFISPAMSDDGTALGAALQVASANPEFLPRAVNSMFLGPHYSMSEVEKVLLDNKVKFHTPSEPEKEVADLLASGKIVAIFQGAMEFGPRSLGHRSILANADNVSINKKLNNKLSRTEFMPFAPMCLEEDASWLFKDIDKVKHAAEFMTITLQCTDDMQRLCPAVVHCDGTARPQLVTKKTNPFIHKVITNYKQISSKPALVNTSFNVHEEPIVCSPADAIKGFFESGLDALYIEGHLVELSNNTNLEIKYLRNKINANNTSLSTLKNQLSEQETQVKIEKAEIQHLHDKDKQLNHELWKTKAQLEEKQAVLLVSETALIEQSTKAGALQTQLESSHTQLDEKNQALLANEAALTEQSTLATTLQSKLTETQSKVDELNQSNHHWYITSQQLDEELKAVYASKSWRIMLRLRQIIHGGKKS